MSFGVPDFEQRLSHLQAQLDRLEHLPPGEPGRAEQRLSLLADQFAELLRRWSVLSERQTRAATRLESDLGEWNAAGVRLQDDTARRLIDLESRLQREWQELRERYEAPVRRLHEDAASLTQVTIATASNAQQHFERSEARLSAIEETIGGRLAELSRQMQDVSADIQAFRRSSPESATEASLVTPSPGLPSSDPQIEVVLSDAVPAEPATPQVVPESSSATDMLFERLNSLERTLAERDAERAEEHTPVSVSFPAVDALSERFASLERAFAEREADRETFQAAVSVSPTVDALAERFTSLERAFAEQDAERRASQATTSTPPAVDALSDRLTSLERTLAEHAAERAGSQEALSRSAAAIDTVLERIGGIERAVAERDPAPASASVPPAVDALTERLAALERVLAERGAEMREVSQQVTRDLRAWRLAAAVLALLGLGSGVLAWSLRRDVRTATQLADESRRDRGAITDTAARELATTRDSAARELKEAMEQTARARTISEVLAAPDAVRYDLVGRDSLAGAAAQLRWSRSRGFVFSGSRIPVPPPDSAYQVWLLTRTGAVRAATFAPDETGAVTIAAPLPQIPGAIIGAFVTTEPAAGSEAPTGSPVLARLSEPASPPVPEKPDGVLPLLR